MGYYSVNEMKVKKTTNNISLVTTVIAVNIANLAKKTIFDTGYSILDTRRYSRYYR